MHLSSPISINPPAYSDNNNNIVNPPTIIFNELSITYCDDEARKNYYIKIEQIPYPLYLFAGDEYNLANPISKDAAKQKLIEKLGDNPAQVLRSLFPKTLEENPNGPGTLLSNMIKKVGIVMTQGCSCRRHAIEMNEQGNDWCEQNIDTIVGWLREEASKRKLPFLDSVGKLMVNRAIKKSRKLLANQSVPENDEDLDNIE